MFAFTAGTALVTGLAFGLLLGLQVAFTVALVATAAVYYRSLREMAAVGVGYATDRLLVAHMGAHSLVDRQERPARDCDPADTRRGRRAARLDLAGLLKGD